MYSALIDKLAAEIATGSHICARWPCCTQARMNRRTCIGKQQLHLLSRLIFPANYGYCMLAWVGPAKPPRLCNLWRRQLTMRRYAHVFWSRHRDDMIVEQSYDKGVLYCIDHICTSRIVR